MNGRPSTTKDSRDTAGTGTTVVAIIVAAMALRLIAIWQYGATTIKFGDGPDYLSAARSICAGYYPERSVLPFFRVPGLPFFIAASTFCHTASVFVVKIALAVAGSLTVGVMFWLTQDLFIDRAASFLAAGMTAIYPFFIMQSADIESEGLFMLLLVTSVWLSLRIDHGGAMFVAGLAAAAAALTRPIGLILVFLTPIGILTIHKGCRTQRIRSLLFYCGAIVCCLGPWIIRNEMRFHELILVNDAGGYNFWRGTSPEMAAANRITDPQAFAETSVTFETQVTPMMAREIERSAQTPKARSRGWYRLAYKNFAKDPAAFAGRLIRNAWVYWRPWLNPVTASWGSVLASAVIVTMLYVFGAWGWCLLFRRDKTVALWCLLLGLSFWILQIPFQVVSRFRVPITDPFLIVFAGESVGRLLCLFRPTRQSGA